MNVKRLILISCIWMSCIPVGHTQDWMPDPALREAIGESIGLPAGTPLEKRHLEWIEFLGLHDKGITDLTGLEFAMNLRELHISKNPITDLSPLANLMKLEELHFWHSTPPSPTGLDLSPLAKLTNLRVLSLSTNNITDISPLTGLKNLRHLHIIDNDISDVSPLVGLRHLRELWIAGNPILDIRPLFDLDLTEFEYHENHDEICKIPRDGSAIDRIQNRHFPSVALWPYRGSIEEVSQYDYLWGRFELLILKSYSSLYSAVVGDVQMAEAVQRRWRELNPNSVFLFPVSITFAVGNEFPEDSDVWFRDAMGKRVSYVEERWGGWHEYTFDIVHEHVQDKLVAQILAVAECGLFDGISIDGLASYGTGYFQRVSYPATNEDIIVAIGRILREVRARVPEDFLIVVNSNRDRLERYAEYINGNAIESGNDYPGGYTYRALQELDDALLWNERNLRSPQINWSEGFLIEDQSPESPDNRRWMRVFTTRSLTLSNGYVSIHHEASHVSGETEVWYDFWDADLGQPIGEKAQRYRNIDGLFIREFTNGWAVYNRSGKPQDIQLPEKVSGWASGVKNKRWHTIPDLDGEIYLKSGLETPPTGQTTPAADVNEDGVVNILDLVAVTNAFGEDTPDINGDGTVNVLDLVAVANAFE